MKTRTRFLNGEICVPTWVNDPLSPHRYPKTAHPLPNRYNGRPHPSTLLATRCVLEVWIVIEEFWRFEPDNSKEVWAILTTRTLRGKIVGWKIAYANPARVVRIVESASRGDEHAVLECFVEEIRHCKRGTTLITFSQETLPLLRGKILAHNIKNTSFRGLVHLCIENLLEYFAGWDVAEGVSHDPRVLWKLLTNIGRLVPTRALEGEPL